MGRGRPRSGGSGLAPCCPWRPELFEELQQMNKNIKKKHHTLHIECVFLRSFVNLSNFDELLHTCITGHKEVLYVAK